MNRNRVRHLVSVLQFFGMTCITMRETLCRILCFFRSAQKQSNENATVQLEMVSPPPPPQPAPLQVKHPVRNVLHSCGSSAFVLSSVLLGHRLYGAGLLDIVKRKEKDWVSSF